VPEVLLVVRVALEDAVAVLVDAVAEEVQVVREAVVLELPVVLKVEVTVDDSVEVVRPSQVSSQLSYACCMLYASWS
jgi:hypothetical protein